LGQIPLTVIGKVVKLAPSRGKLMVALVLGGGVLMVPSIPTAPELEVTANTLWVCISASDPKITRTNEIMCVLRMSTVPKHGVNGYYYTVNHGVRQIK
jgi:hypothetical protein